MLDLMRIAATAALLAAGPAMAQDAAAPAEAPAAPAEAPAQAAPQQAQPPQPYTLSTHTDWIIRCVPNEEGQDPCTLYQLLRDQAGNAVAEINLFPLPDGQQAAFGGTIITPLETLLTQQISLQIDSGEVKRYPFSFCAQIGCVSRVGFTEAEVTALKRGNAAKMSIVPMAAPDQKVELTVSLSGFTAGHDAIREALGL